MDFCAPWEGEANAENRRKTLSKISAIKLLPSLSKKLPIPPNYRNIIILRKLIQFLSLHKKLLPGYHFMRGLAFAPAQNCREGKFYLKFTKAKRKNFPLWWFKVSFSHSLWFSYENLLHRIVPLIFFSFPQISDSKRYDTLQSKI